MTARFLWSTALKDLRRRRRDPVSLILWIGIPMVITLLLYLVFGRGGGTPHGRLLVADEDQTFASSLVTGAFRQDRLAEMITVEKVKLEDGRARLQKEDGSALLVIPKGFGQALLRSEPASLTLVTNPAQSILPGIIEETLSIVLDGAFYLQLIAGEQLKVVAAGPPGGATTFPDSAVAIFSVTINRLVKRLQTYLNPPLIELKTTVIEEGGRARSNFAAAFFPGMLFLAVLFMAQGLSLDLWKERDQGTLRRAATTPRGMAAFLAGKVLSVTLLVAAVGLVGLLGGRWILGLEMTNLAPAVLWVAFAGTALFLLMMLLQLFASSARMGSVLSSFVMFPLAMGGGCFFPFEAMPAGMAAIGRLTPNGAAIVELQAILGNSVEPGRLAAVVTALAAFSAVAFFIGARRLRGGFTHS